MGDGHQGGNKTSSEDLKVFLVLSIPVFAVTFSLLGLILVQGVVRVAH